MAKLEAARETAKDRASAASKTRAVVAADTSGEPRSARETVGTETPARRATSAMLAGACLVTSLPV